MAVNVDGVFWCVREAARAMVERGAPGAIVCTASINVWHVEETMAAYNVSKAGVHAIVRSAASGCRATSPTPCCSWALRSPHTSPDRCWSSMAVKRWASREIWRKLQRE
jgi:NAD(P)-dependent dehydrogenase (short-subunit alcohol dehydrogenase family)